MITDDERALIWKHLPDGSDAEEEEALLLTLPHQKQLAVLKRLKALDQYLTIQEPTAEDAAQSASELEMSTRNFYRLVSSLNAKGPVQGLAPNLRMKQRPSAARDGFGLIAEKALSELLARTPDARWRQAVDVIKDACGETESMPSQAAVRRRLLALRSSGQLRATPDALFGDRILVDHSVLDLPIGNSGRERYAVVTLIVDTATRVILGSGIGDSALAPDSGLFAALGSALRRTRGIATTNLPLAKKLRAVDWVVPEGLEAKAELFRSHAQASFPDIEVEVDEQGTRRHGARLLRLLGDRLGPYKLRTRWSTALPRKPRTGQRAPVSESEAELLVDRAVREWNSFVLEPREPWPPPRVRAARRRKLMRLEVELLHLFSPALSAGFREWLDNLQRSKRQGV